MGLYITYLHSQIRKPEVAVTVSFARIGDCLWDYNVMISSNERITAVLSKKTFIVPMLYSSINSLLFFISLCLYSRNKVHFKFVNIRTCLIQAPQCVERADRDV
jgi:hypothetical protein